MTLSRSLSPRPARILGVERTVFFLGLASLLNDTSSEIIYPLLPVFLISVLGAGPVYIGLIEGAAESASSLVKLASGWVSDRWRRRKPLVVVGYGLAAVGRPLIALAGQPWQVLAIRFADRTGKGIRSAPRDAMLADASSPTELGWSFGFHRGMDHVGAVLGPLLAFALLAFLGIGYRLLFLLAAIPAAAAVIVILAATRESLVPQPPTRADRGGGHLSIRFRRYLTVIVIFTLGNSTDAFLLLRAQDLGVAVAHLPLLWVVLHVVKSASSAAGGALSDRLGRRHLIAAGWLLYAVVYAGFATAQGSQAAWLLFAVYGVFFGMTEGAERALIADLVTPASRGTAYGLYNLAIGIGALPASLITGGLWAWAGAPAALGCGAALALVASILLLIWVPETPRRR